MLDQRLAALDTPFRPINRLLIQSEGNAKNGGAGVCVGLRKEISQHAEAFTNFPDDIFIWDKAILKNKFGFLGKPLDHLVVDTPNGEPWSISFDQETRAAFDQRLALFRLHEQKVKTGAVSVREKVFHAIDDPAALSLLAVGSERRWIGQEIIRGVIGLSNADRQHSAWVFAERRHHPHLLFGVECLLHNLRNLQGLREND